MSTKVQLNRIESSRDLLYNIVPLGKTPDPPPRMEGGEGRRREKERSMGPSLGGVCKGSFPQVLISIPILQRACFHMFSVFPSWAIPGDYDVIASQHLPNTS